MLTLDAARIPALRLSEKQIVPRLMQLKQRFKSYPVVGSVAFLEPMLPYIGVGGRSTYRYD